MVANRKARTVGPSRGGIPKHRSALRTDRDGDLVMDASARGRGGIAKTGRGGGRGGRLRKAQATDDTPDSARDAANAARLQRDLLRNMSTGNAVVRASKSQSLNSMQEKNPSPMKRD